MANNDQADLRGKLETQIGETHDATGPNREIWTTSELNYLVDQAVESLYPRFSRPLDSETTTITLVDDTLYYALPTGVRAVSRLDLFDANSSMVQVIPGRSWEVTGDPLGGAGRIFISDAFATTNYTARLSGYGAYDTATNLIPDLYASLVLARARAEAYRRVGADRARFTAWLARNQSQNVSVNELLQLINEADNEARQLEARIPKVFQKPVSAYTG